MHLDENVSYGLRQRNPKPSKAEIDRAVDGALAMVRLEGYGKRRSHELSGGQQQRVALARALINRLGKDGGEIWVDHYAVIKGAPNRDAAYAFLDFILTPAVNAREIEAHGTPTTDARVLKLLPGSILNNPILYPAAGQLSALEYGAAETLTNPDRAELMARFKSA